MNYKNRTDRMFRACLEIVPFRIPPSFISLPPSTFSPVFFLTNAFRYFYVLLWSDSRPYAVRSFTASLTFFRCAFAVLLAPTAFIYHFPELFGFYHNQLIFSVDVVILMFPSAVSKVTYPIFPLPRWIVFFWSWLNI